MEASGSSASFEILGRIVEGIGRRAVGELLDVARAEWAAGRPGPLVTSPEGVEPPYKMTVSQEGVAFRYGEQTGVASVQALEALAAIAV